MAWRSGAPVEAPADAEPLSRWGALAYPAYRRYWLGNLARVFGLQFRFIGSLWLVQELTGSTAWLGIISIASAVPTIVLSLPAGTLADRMDNKRLLVWSQGLTALFTLALALAVVLDVVNVWHVVAWSVVVGALMALGNPAQNAILPRLIEMRAIASAVAYTSAIWNSMRIIGPFIAGLLIAVIGTGQAFFVTAAGFALSALLIQSLRLAPVEGTTARQHGGGMLEGVRYIFANRIFLATIGLSFFTSIFGSSYIVLLPNFADEVLGVGVEGFGMMETAAGVGALLGTLSVAKIGAGPRHGPIMLLSAAAFGLLIAAFAASRSMPLTLALLFGGGFTSSVYLNLGMTSLQILVPNELRGRVMGVWSMTWFLSSVGGLPAGLVAEWLGAPMSVALGALSVTAFALALLVTVPSLRRMAAPKAAAA
jgi:MFS family permease